MTPAYRAERLRYVYDGGNGIAMDGFEIPAGSVTALIGPNGAGKSTLLEHLAFLKSPQEGRLIFQGRPVLPGLEIELRRRVGWVAQNPYFVQGTVLVNVELGLNLRGIGAAQRRNAVLQALARVGMEEAVLRPVAQLSGGERQKIALARALAPQPEVLLWDEPFTYLDQDSVQMVERLFAEFAGQGGTLVFSTHERLRGMALAGQALSLVGGRLVAAPLVNLYHGRLRGGDFDTGKLIVHVPRDVAAGSHVAVDPEELVLSHEPLQSSLRNAFAGRVVAVAEQGDKVAVTVEAGERFNALITWEAYQELALALGQSVWVSFKATAVKVF